MQVAVGVGDCRVSNDPECVLVTYALGSCIAVLIHDPTAGVGGLLHFALPDSGLDRERRGSAVPVRGHRHSGVLSLRCGTERDLRRG